MIPPGTIVMSRNTLFICRVVSTNEAIRRWGKLMVIAVDDKIWILKEGTTLPLWNYKVDLDKYYTIVSYSSELEKIIYAD